MFINYKHPGLRGNGKYTGKERMEREGFVTNSRLKWHLYIPHSPRAVEWELIPVEAF